MNPKIDTLVRGSCFDEKRGLFAFRDDSVDHTVTDPPYAKYVHKVGLPTSHHASLAYKTPEGDMGFAEFTPEDRVVFAELVVRVTKGWALIFSDVESAGDWSRALVGAGAKRRNTMIWTKTNAAPKFQGDGPANGAETIVTAWCGTGASVWNAGGCSGHYHYPIEQRNRRHPTQKPLPLMRQLLIDFTMPGDLILDPFAGGGSTLIAAKQLRRHFMGFEIADSQTTLQGLHAAQEALRTVRPFTHNQCVMLHRQRKDRAYAGSRAKVTASREFDLDQLGIVPSTKQPPPIPKL